MKNVQIPEDLFFDVCRYFLAEDPEDPTERDLTREAIEKGLTDKLEAMQRRAAYSAYKDRSLSPEARQEARKAYLDMVAMLPDYRWSGLEPPE